ncbi:Ger(x)C family spore germination protein [Evansella tamaricis]|uniref:Ger(X)C family spore germination protein n=1 Tax=Evansella tamaricis TaxID=2069301 RepID=A0ABS6JRA6_9BACI|nr:Ger(x)C family spore germination protein [Evansella tamaricis]MBU9714833.1 Ger(x)C family spore germination protein [Evansella tamaricis]
MKRLLVILPLFFLLSSCIGKEEINDLALVMAVGFDKNEEDEIVITAQIAQPGDVRGDAATAGQTGSPLWTVYAEGKSIFEAIRNIARFSSRRVYWAHNFIIVVNEQVAKEDGIVDVIDFFNRNNQLRMRTWIVITEGEAKEIVATQTGLEVITGESLDKLFRYSRIVAEAPRTDIMTLSAAYMGEHTQPYLAMVSLKNHGIDAEKEFGDVPQVELSGTAILKNDKMVGKLNQRGCRGFYWFVETVESGIIPLTCPEEEGRVSVELRENRFELTPNYKNGLVSFDVSVDSKADLVELGCPTEMEHSEVVDSLAKHVETELKSEIEAMLSTIQGEFKVDSIRLGRTFYGKFPKEWEGLKDDWEDLFPNVPINIDVSVEINDPLLLENPTRPSKD